jgi:DnaJ-class molecular chaperone
MPVKDYYKTLEVPPDALPQDIKKAWRRLARMYHPDKDSAGRFAVSYFHELQEAYEILSDSRRRARYDEERWLDGYARKK